MEGSGRGVGWALKANLVCYGSAEQAMSKVGSVGSYVAAQGVKVRMIPHWVYCDIAAI